MNLGFTENAQHSISRSNDLKCLEKLPEMIQEHTDWNYSCELRNYGCLLKPCFCNMPYRNSFVPEIEISASENDSQIILDIKGRPTKSVRIFTLVWCAVLAFLEMFFLVMVATSQWRIGFSVFVPVVIGVFLYLLCKISTKLTFSAVVKAIRKELR